LPKETFTCGIYVRIQLWILIFITKRGGIIKGDCQDTVKYRIPGYFLNTEYQDENAIPPSTSPRRICLHKAQSTGVVHRHPSERHWAAIAALEQLLEAFAYALCVCVCAGYMCWVYVV